MKKTSINLLCILIIVTLAASLMMPIYYIGYSFGYGFARGFNNPEEAKKNIVDTEMYDLAFNPDISLFIESQDSVRMTNGNVYPAIIQRATVIVPHDEAFTSTASTTISAVISVLNACMAIAVLVTFIMFVVNINRRHIFEDKNIKLLRLMGWLLISIALTQVAGGLIDDYLLDRTGIAIEGYSISTFWTLPWTSLVFGLLSLLMAQVWARGIALKRDQELTI